MHREDATVNKKYLFLPVIFLLILTGEALGEGLFDSAVSDDKSSGEYTEANSSAALDKQQKEMNENPASGSSASFSGSVKALLNSGINRNEDNSSTENSFTEFRGKVTASPSGNIKAFSEIVAKGNPYSETGETEIELREAYIDIYSSLIDISVGEKIIAWGRADAVNPTNKITPLRNSSVSSVEDDRRMGNLLAEARLNLYPFTFTAIWLPLYKESGLPSFIESSLSKPDPVIENSSFAVKTDFESSDFEFSLSYFNGYNPSPGISGITSSTMALKPYRIHNIGFDFSTAVSDYGIRGETAVLIPFKDHEEIYVPSPEISYIAGIDRSIGDFTLILQYSGKFITDFIEKKSLTGLTVPESEIENMNRIISSQTEEIIHSAVFRISLDLFYETLSLETAGSWNFTTEELFLKPLVVWDAADSLTVSGGAFFYAGKDNTLFGMMEEKSSSVFAEVKLCF